MTNKLEFDIPSDKKVDLVAIAIIVVSIVDVTLFCCRGETVVDVPLGRLDTLDRILLAAPFWGLLWIIFSGFGRKHTAGYYFRYRYGQTLSFLLFFTAVGLGTNTLFRQFDPTSYGSALGNYYATLTFMFIIWGLIVSVVAIPIILWRSKRISARSVSKTPVASKKVDTAKRSSQQISQSSNVAKARPDQSAVEAAQTVKTETKPVQDTPTKKRLPERKQESIDDSADELYAIAWDEVEANNTDKGLWARLYVEHNGDEGKTRVAYLKERVAQLTEEQKVLKEQKEAIEKVALGPELARFVEKLIQKGYEAYPAFLDIPLAARSFRLLNCIQNGLWSQFLEYLANGANPKHCSTDKVLPLAYARKRGNQDFIEALEFAIELWDRELLDEKGIYHSVLKTIDTSQYK